MHVNFWNEVVPLAANKNDPAVLPGIKGLFKMRVVADWRFSQVTGSWSQGLCVLLGDLYAASLASVSWIVPVPTLPKVSTIVFHWLSVWQMTGGGL